MTVRVDAHILPPDTSVASVTLYQSPVGSSLSTLSFPEMMIGSMSKAIGSLHSTSISESGPPGSAPL